MYPSAINLLLLLYFTHLSPVTQMVKRKRRGNRQKINKMPSYTISDEELAKVVHDFLDPPAGMVGLGVSIRSSTKSQHPALSQDNDANENTVTNPSHGFDDTVTDEQKASDGIKPGTDGEAFGEMGTDSALSHTSTDKQAGKKAFDPHHSSNTTNPSTKFTSTVQSTKDTQLPGNTSKQDPSRTPTIPSQPTTHSTHEIALNARLAAHAAALDTHLSAHKTALDARLTTHENTLDAALATHLATLQTNLRNDTHLALQLLEHNLHVIPHSYLDSLPRKNDIRNDHKDLVAHVNEALDRGTRIVQSAVVEILHEEMRMLRMGVVGKEKVGLQDLFGEVGGKAVGRRGEERRPLETVGAVPEEEQAGDGPDFVVLGVFVLGFFLLWLSSPRG